MSKRPLPLFLIAVLALGVGAACTPSEEPGVDAGGEGEGEGEGEDPCAIEQYVSEDTTLTADCSPYVLEDGLEVTDGATLTIEPGVELQFASSTWLRVGAGGTGRLVADATDGDPIVLTTSDAQGSAGAWIGVFFAEGTLNGSVLRGVTISKGGEATAGGRGCVTVDGAPEGRITLEDSTLEDCAIAAVSVSSAGSAFASLENNVLRRAPVGFSVEVTAVGSIGTQAAYEDVPVNRTTGGTVTRSTTWTTQPQPWEVLEDIEVRGDDSPVLTLEAGAVLRFDQGVWLRVGASTPGGLVAVGSAEAPVIFEALDAAPAAGDWLGIFFADKTLNDTRLEHVEVRHGGEDLAGGHGCVTVESTLPGRVSIERSRFVDCAQSGVHVWGDDSTFGAFSENTFESCERGVWVPAPVVGSLSSDLEYSDTPVNRIDGSYVDSTQTWLAQDVPWIVVDSIEVSGEDSPVLTLEAGTVLRFPQGTWLRVGGGAPGSLIAQGESDNPVVFESSQPTPAAGSWLGIFFAPATMSGALLDHVVLRHGGQDLAGQYGGVTFLDTGTTVTISDSVFEANASGDIFIDCLSQPTLSDNFKPDGTTAASVLFEQDC